MKSNPPLFIVGPPRSGTTLLAAMIGAHSSFSCGTETHFFNKIGERKIEECIADPDWPKKAVHRISSLKLANQKLIDLVGISQEETRKLLQQKAPSVRSMLEVLTAKESKTRRWAEKTPNHIRHLPFIRKHFPDAKILRIVRDPRDVSISIGRLPWASSDPIPNAILVSDWLLNSQAFFNQDPDSFTIKFEDLIAKQQQTLRKICDFLGEEFEPEMMDTSKSAESVRSRNETWKQQVSAEIDLSKSYSWRRNPDEKLIRALSLITNPVIELFGYEDNVVPERNISFSPHKRRVVNANADLIRELALQGIRLAPELGEAHPDIILSSKSVSANIRSLFMRLAGAVNRWS